MPKLNTKSELWFKRLELENFRQYNGKHSIDFSIDPKKHLTVVHAENSVGKTTMLNAIKWCLYKVTPEFDNTKILVTDRSEKKICRVRLNFKYGEKEYTAIRVYDQKTFTSKLTLSTIAKNSHKQDPVDNPDVVINNILPSELSNYFLFAGERYSKALGEGNNVSHIRAIRDILGFTMSESVISDIEHLRRKNNKELATILENDKETKSLGTDLKLLEKDKLGYETLKKTLVTALEEQTVIMIDNSAKITSSSHAKAEQLGKDQTTKDGQLKVSKNHRVDYLKRRQKLVSEFGYILFGLKLTKKNFDHIKTNHASIPSPYAENVVQKLIADKKCICDREVLPNSPELKALERIRDGATTKIIETRVMNAIAQGEHSKKRSKDFLSNLEEIETGLQKYETEIAALEKDLIKIGDSIKAIGNVDISEYQRLRDAAKNEIDAILIKQGALKRDIESNNSAITSLANRIRHSTVNNTETIKLQRFVSLCDKLLKRLDITLKTNEAHSIKAITKLVQKNITESLRKPKDVVLTKEYKFQLMDRETGLIDSGSDGGNGQTLLSNLSFISALISTSKDRAKEKEKSIFVPGTIAPFVIDAPFAEMDNSYRLNTFEFLPKQSHQLILLLSSGQWNDNFEEKIGKYIGKRYLLINHDLSNNFENNTLIINKKSHELNVHSNSSDSKFSASTIKEI